MAEVYNCIGFTNLCFIIIFLLLLPISELYFALNYGDQISCQTQPITLKFWLNIKGVYTLLITFLLIISYYLNKKSFLIYYIIRLIGVFFNFLWLIEGSVLFWQYCNNLKPYNINILMYLSLIIGYITLFQIYALNKIEKNDPKKPLLEV